MFKSNQTLHSFSPCCWKGLELVLLNAHKLCRCLRSDFCSERYELGWFSEARTDANASANKPQSSGPLADDTVWICKNMVYNYCILKLIKQTYLRVIESISVNNNRSHLVSYSSCHWRGHICPHIHACTPPVLIPQSVTFACVSPQTTIHSKEWLAEGGNLKGRVVDVRGECVILQHQI